jgi:inhibitor of cysteine peptidase
MKKLTLPLLITALALAGCGGQPTPAPVEEPANNDPGGGDQLVISDPGKSIEVTAGNEFKIIINSNPSTGYHWELIGNLDETKVQFVSKDYRADEPVMPGSGGSDVWTFKALAAGETKIVLGNYPPGEGQPDVQEVTFTIIIK